MLEACEGHDVKKRLRVMNVVPDYIHTVGCCEEKNVNISYISRKYTS
jgi:hypothetical protein